MKEQRVIAKLQPQPVWNYFANICKIPRPSGHEQKISNYVKKVGEKLGLETILDKVGNVIIKNPATAGMENLKTVILQAHVDIVADKEAEVEHDFTKDPIDAYIDGDWVKARGTTLGADNGIGMAMILALLNSTEVRHGPLVAVFTVDEEQGFTGANTLCTSGLIAGDILLNLDGEDDSFLYIGPAGGTTTKITLPYEPVAVPADSVAFKIRVFGLRGGHSGAEIHLERGNAIKVLVRLLVHCGSELQMRLATINGGKAFNAIPRVATATITIPAKAKDKFTTCIKKLTALIKDELEMIDDGLQVELSSVEMPERVLEQGTQERLLHALLACPHGVLKMSRKLPGIVETSNNLGVIETTEKAIQVLTMQRSALNSARDNAREMITALFTLIGGKIEHPTENLAWQPNLNSEILTILKRIYEQQFEVPPKINAIHAGLEWGVFLEALPNLDMVSMGPTMHHVHTPNERVAISSVQKFWTFLIAVLANIPQK